MPSRGQGYSYEWNADQTEATVIPDDLGTVNKDYPNPARPGGNQTWTFPARAECISCHLPATGYQIGLELVQLNRDFTYPDGTRENQLAAWERRGMFDLALTRPFPAALPDPAGTAGSLEQRARSYLHANCASCHRPLSIYPGVDLRFTTNLQGTNSCNVVPLKGDLGVMGAMRLAPGRPEASTLTLRMKIRELGQMPTIATSIVDTTGVQLIEGWIRSVTTCPPRRPHRNLRGLRVRRHRSGNDRVGDTLSAIYRWSRTPSCVPDPREPRRYMLLL